MAEILNGWGYRQARSRLREAESPRQAAGLAAAIAGYDALQGSGRLALELRSLSEIGQALAKARLVRGWTQAELAGKLDMPKQQVQRYEATGYASVSMARIERVAAVLGIGFTGTASVGRHPVDPWGVEHMLAGLAAAESLQATERRMRLRRLTAAGARRIFDDLCETYYRLAPHHSTAPAEGRKDLAHRLIVRRAIRRLADR